MAEFYDNCVPLDKNDPEWSEVLAKIAEIKTFIINFLSGFKGSQELWNEINKALSENEIEWPEIEQPELLPGSPKRLEFSITKEE